MSDMSLKFIKIILVLLIFPIFILSFCYSKSYKVGNIQSEIINLFENECKIKFSKIDDELFHESYVAQKDDFQILICEKKFADKNIDCDDWYNSKQMENLYKEAKRKRNFQYGYGDNNKIEFFQDIIFSNYCVFSMFDIEDVRFERFFIIFTNQSALIIQLKDISNSDVLTKELYDLNYLVINPDYDENCYVWDYQNDKKQLLMKDLESKKLKGTHIQNQYDFTEEKYTKLIQYFRIGR